MSFKLNPVLLLACTTLLLPATDIRAQRPNAADLLPEKTVGVVRIRSVPSLVKGFQATALGKMLNDEQMRPLVGELYKSAAEGFTSLGERLGVTLEELLTIPQGEVFLALVPPEEGRPEIVLLVDVGNRSPGADALLERLDEAMLQGEAAREEEELNNTSMVVYTLPGRRRRLAIVRHEGVVLASSSADLAREMLKTWLEGSDVNTLSDNRRYATIMNRCRGDKDQPPQLSLFLDPFGFAESASRGNFGAQAGLATAKALSLDDIKGIGGSITFAGTDFDTLAEAHLLLASPREGVLRLLAMESGEVAPEPWVPDDVASYTTVNWNVRQTYDEVVDLYEMFRGPESWFDQVVGPLSDRLGTDFEIEFLDQLDGRASYATWIEKPARVNSQANLVGVRLKAPKRTVKMLAQVMTNLGERMEKKTYGTNEYYRIERGERRRRNIPEFARIPTPCVAVVGDCLLISDSEKLMQEAFITKRTAGSSLADDIEFKLIASRIKRQVGEAALGLISFTRPEESLRLLYEMATEGPTRGALDGAEQPFAQAISQALNDNPLPPFAVIAQYLAPGGSLIVSDPSGFHYTNFTLKRE